MKKALAILAVLGLASASAYGGSMIYSCTRDAGLHQAGGEQHSNAGGAGNVRVGKGGPGLAGSQEMVVFQWDNHAEIAAWMEAEAVATGYTDLADAVANGAVTVNFIVAAPSWQGDQPAKRVNVQTVWSENDWTEGDGPNNFAEYNWTTPSAATFLHAQDMIPLSAGAIDWVDPSSGLSVPFRNLPGMPNSQKIMGLFATPDPGNVVWNQVTLDTATWQDLILHQNPFNYPCVGLATSGDGWGNRDNDQIYLREQWGGTADPSLYIAIPEPATMLLVGAGVVGLVLRKKR
jgi:hypothetical protein